MAKLPALVNDLLAELPEENLRNTVHTVADSKMVILFEDASKGDIRYEFNGNQCKLLLASRETVARFFEALNFPDEAAVELHALSLDLDVTAKLESTFSTVDEF